MVFDIGWKDGSTTGSGSGRLSSSTKTPAMEKIVRSFETPKTDPARARRTPVESDGDLAILTWGGEISINDASSGGFSTNNPGGADEPQPGSKTLVYNEISRTTNTVRVTNPTDAQDYVDVERITSITFAGPDGKNVKFVLNN
jgi:hypothetical protein